jgi:hypothetical protein
MCLYVRMLSTLIFHFQILVDETGLNYVCQTAERFFAVSNVLSNMVTALVRDPSVRLLKHIIRCYLRLSENPYDSHFHAQHVSRFFSFLCSQSFFHHTFAHYRILQACT